MSSVAASEELAFEDLLNADFEELMSISVVTPSRREQSLFEVPVSTSVLTQQQIQQSGATSLAEVLRLFPGVIVREFVSGQYDVHIRGLDNVPPNKGYPDNFNKSTLVMIDHRPVYNHLNGAMLWAELPIDIHDIDRIELVRGPVGSLYGANAATGVIHFITDLASTEKNYVSWSRGEYRSEDIRMRFSSKLNEHSALAGSFHHKQRRRTDDVYYSFPDASYVPVDQVKEFGSNLPIDPLARYPDTGLAEDKTAINLFLDIYGNNNALTRVSAGTTVSEFQGIIFTRTSPLGIYDSEHSYFGIHHKRKDVLFNLNARVGEIETISVNDFDFDYINFQTSLDYHLIQQEALEFSLGASFENVKYRSLFFDGEVEQENSALSAQFHYDLTERVHFTSAVRGDYFKVPNKVFYSFSAGLNYRHDERLNARLYMGRSFQSPFFVETSFDVGVSTPSGQFNFLGNQSLDLVTIDSAELGIRYRFTDQQLLDWEMFISQSDNYSDIATSAQAVGGQVIVTSTFEAIHVEATQFGTTASWQSQWLDSLSTHVYMTVQRTLLDDAVEFSGALSDREHESTPSVYGGGVVNYHPTPDWNLNISAYFLSDQAFDYRDVDEASHPSSVYSEDSRWVVNTKLSYQLSEEIQIYLNGRNLVNSRQPQLVYLDRLNALWMAGIDINF
jgi:iron complex outermembrane receptor protein